jgi:surface antigen
MKATIFFAVALALTGCASQQVSDRPLSYLSSSLGSNMDSTDHARANEALEGGSEDIPISWINPISLKRFTVTPTKTYRFGGKDCRSYRAIYGGRGLSGDACRVEDGTWLAR